MFTPDSEWKAPSLSDLPRWDGVPRIGLDTEGCDPQLTKLGPGVRRDGYTCGISFAFEDGPAHYMPMRHLGGGNLDPDRVEAYMKDQAKTYTGTICGANLQYDLDYLAERGIVFRQAKFKDIQVAEPLIDENQLSYSLETLAQKYGYMGKDETLLKEAAAAYGWTAKEVKKNMWQLPAKFVGPYAIEDAILPLLILRKQERVIEDQELDEIYALECRVLPVLVKMKRRGIRIDFDQLERVEALTIKKEQEFLNLIYDQTGVRIRVDEINKTKLVVRALDTAQIPYGQTEPSSKFPDGQPSVKKEYLEPNKDLPLVNAILEARSYNKVRNTFVKSIRNHQTNGRIHCTFNQLRRQDDNSDDVKGAGPGRLSSCDPNLQQQPSRHPVLGKMWRSIYLPDEGGRWAALDYCFSADTEVLTEQGFVPFPELSRDVKVAQWEKVGEKYEVTYAMPEAYQVVPHNGDIVHISGGRSTDLLVTPNHNCPLEHKSTGKIKVFKAANYPLSACYLQQHAGILAGDKTATDEEIVTVCAVQADAAYRRTNYRISVGKPRKIARIKKYIQYQNSYPKSTTGQTFFVVGRNAVSRFLLDGARKVFNREELLALTPECRMRFLEELLLWDGSGKFGAKAYYCTTELENAKIVEEVAVLTGVKTTFRAWEQPNKKTAYFVSFSKRSKISTAVYSKTNVPYSGNVYCVTMPQHTVIVRRKGRVMLSKQSQQEPRLFIHYAHIAGCAGTQGAVEGFHAGHDWHDMTTEMAFDMRKYDYCQIVDGREVWVHDADKKKWKILRGRAKAVFLGLTYGMGQAKMCKSCGFATEIINIRGAEREVAGPEGRAFLASFNAKVPFLGEIKDMVERVAWNRKYIQTILGRHIHYPPGAGMERKALNNLIQGSAADQTKLAMVLMDENNYRIQLQIHDEIDTTVYDESTPREMAEIMTNCVKLVVPSKVDIEIGDNWGDSME